MSKRVTGLGGVFFKADDPSAQRDWYRDRLGLDMADWGAKFMWRDHGDPDSVGYTVWSAFDKDTEYFAPSEKPAMINYRVADLESLLATLKSEGVTIVGDMVTEANGKFGWIMDPEGNKIELWEPVPSDKDPYL